MPASTNARDRARQSVDDRALAPFHQSPGPEETHRRTLTFIGRAKHKRRLSTSASRRLTQCLRIAGAGLTS